MKRLYYILFILILAVPLAHSAWDNTEPADASQWNVCAGYIRNNWNALEVVLGVDLNMEGSAVAWYEASAPTTTADTSTALTATYNGMLWVDSDSRALYTYIYGTGFVGTDTLPSVVTFTAADTTPTVVLSSVFETNTGALTISDFDDGTDGKVIYVLSKGTITYDVDTAQGADYNLDGSSADVVTASGDITVWRNEGGTTWHLVRFNDASVDNSDANVAEKATSASVTTAIAAATDGTAPTNLDTGTDAMVISHAYLAQSSGFVTAYTTANSQEQINGFIHTTTDPAGAGTNVARAQVAAADSTPGITFFVPDGWYFEVTTSGNAATIYWTALPSGGAAPVDQD